MVSEQQECVRRKQYVELAVDVGSLRSTMMNVITMPVSFLGAQSKPCSSFSMFSTKKKKTCGLACVCDLWASNSNKEVVCTFACARLRVLDWACWAEGLVPIASGLGHVSILLGVCTLKRFADSFDVASS